MTEYRCIKCNHEIHFEHGKWHHYHRQCHWAIAPKITDSCSVCGDPIHYDKNGYNRKWFHFYKHNHPAEIQNNGSNFGGDPIQPITISEHPIKYKDIILYVSISIFIIVFAGLILYLLTGKT